MIELLISACLTTTPDCRDFTLLFDAREVSFIACTIHGQSVVAPWQQEHPDWTIQRWSCRQVERHEAAL